MITINVRDIELGSMKIKKFAKRFPDAVNEGMNKWGRRFAGNLKLSLNHHLWSGKTRESVRWEQKRREMIGLLWMSKSGVYLDRARPHFVSFKHKKIADWAKAYGIAYDVYKKKFVSSGIFVRPHPYIERIYQKALPKLLPTIMSEVDKARR